MEIFPEKEEHQRDTAEEGDKQEELEKDVDSSTKFVQPSSSDVNTEPHVQPEPQTSPNERTDSGTTLRENDGDSSSKFVQLPSSSDVNAEPRTQPEPQSSKFVQMPSSSDVNAEPRTQPEPHSSKFVQMPSSSDVNAEPRTQPEPQSSKFVQLPSSSDVNAEPRAQPAPQSSLGEGTNSRAPPFGNTSYPWTFDGARWNPEFVPWTPDQSGRIPPMVPVLFPAPLPGYAQGQVEDQRVGNGGIFAVPIVPMFGPFVGYPPGGLIPVSYNFPPQSLPGIGTPSSAPQSSERALPGQAPQEAQGVEPPVMVPHIGQAQRLDGQRPIVRRFHVAFQIDLLLILKLAVVVFIFNQDGSKDRLFLLLFLAGLVYLYQTGALTPFLRWLSQSAQRAMMPPQPQQPVHPVPPADARVGAQVQGENAAANGQPPVEAPVGAPGDDQNAPVGGVAGEEARRQPLGHAWWGFLKEIQMLVVGFVTSLLPGFHHHID